MSTVASKRLPSSLDAERAILASILIDAEAIVKVAPILETEDFYSPKHQTVWTAMKSLFLKHEPIDTVTLSAALAEAKSGTDENFVTSLTELAPQTNNVVSYANLIRGTRKMRALIAASAEIGMLAYTSKDWEEVEIAAKELILDAIGTDAGDDKDVRISPERQAEILQHMFRRLRAGENAAIPTGLRTLDKTLAGGVHREEVVIVAARTSVGKSAFAENLLEFVGRKGGRVLNIMLEMSPEQILVRYLIRAGLSPDVVKGLRPPTDDEENRIAELIRQREEWQIFILNKPGVTVSGIHSEISRLTLQEGQLDLVVVDYLQLMGDVNEDKMVTSIAKVTKRLKVIAREFKVPIILISQLNRNVEHRGGKPRLFDLAHSGSIENDADVVLLLWDTPDAPDASGNTVHMYVAKNRQGPKEVEIPIRYYGPNFRFRDAGDTPTNGQHQPSRGADPEASQAIQEERDLDADQEIEGRESPEPVGEGV